MRGTHEGNCAMHSKPAEKEQAHTPRGKAAEHRKKCPRRLPLFFMPPKPHRNADRSHSGRAEADALHMIGPHSGVYAGRARHRRTERQQNKCPKPYGIAARIGKQSGHILRPSKASGRPHPPGRTRPAQDPDNRQGCFAPSAGQAAAAPNVLAVPQKTVSFRDRPFPENLYREKTSTDKTVIQNRQKNQAVCRRFAAYGLTLCVPYCKAPWVLFELKRYSSFLLDILR